MVVGFYPVLKLSGYGMDWRSALVLMWAGLRGAVGLALSLFLLLDNAIPDIEYRTLAFFFMGMMAALTLILQGATTGYLLVVGHRARAPPFSLVFKSPKGFLSREAHSICRQNRVLP
jgi:NhaP-type Na+/H+ or K+/H+ antiporter